MRFMIVVVDNLRSNFLRWRCISLVHPDAPLRIRDDVPPNQHFRRKDGDRRGFPAGAERCNNDTEKRADEDATNNRAVARRSSAVDRRAGETGVVGPAARPTHRKSKT